MGVPLGIAADFSFIEISSNFPRFEKFSFLFIFIILCRRTAGKLLLLFDANVTNLKPSKLLITSR